MSTDVSRQEPPLADLHMPVELTRQRPPRKQRRWLVLAVLGILVASAEALWLSQAFWLSQPSVRMALTPWLDRAGYTLKRPVLPGIWQLSGLSLRAEPGSTEDVWHIEGLLANQADILQPWPILEVTLRDHENRLVGRRQVAAADYLPAGLPRELGAQALVVSDQPVRIQISVQIPARADGSIPAFEQLDVRPLP